MSAAPLPLRVVKVGGSLLDWPPLPAALRSWLAQQSPAINVLVCGGGPLTDAIRAADRALGLGEAAAHWLCIDALSITARLLAALLPGLRVVEEIQVVCGAPSLGLRASLLFDPRCFLRTVEPHAPGNALPHTWRVTTDSITARLAEVLAARELVLLKSAEPPAATLADLAAGGYVDEYFPIAAAANVAGIRFVNLRSQVMNGPAE